MDTGSEIYVVSEHAVVRGQQRGIHRRVIDFVLSNHDRSVHVGNDCRAIFISRKKARSVGADTPSKDLLGQAANVVLVIRPEINTILTVMHACGKSAKRYHKS